MTHIGSGNAFCHGYRTKTMAKQVAIELDSLLPYSVHDSIMDQASKDNRDALRALWSLPTIEAYGKDYKAVSKLYPGK